MITDEANKYTYAYDDQESIREDYTPIYRSKVKFLDNIYITYLY